MISKQNISADAAEKTLVSNDERYRQLVDNIPIGFLTCDTKGNITSLNKALINILGSPSFEATKLINLLTFPLVVQSGIAEQFKKCITNGQIVKYETPYHTKWGKKVYARIHMTPIRDKNGDITGVQALFEDFSDYKLMEEEVTKSRMIESIGVLAGGIAHDFNNLLTITLGNISLAKLYVNETDKIYQLLNEMERANTQAVELTRQLLTFAKGGAPILKTTSISGLVKETAGFALRGSKSKCIFSIPDDLWPVEIDEGQISQVVNNLLINSNHAMPDGGFITITLNNINIIDLEMLPLDAGQYVLLTIEDQGHGIEDEHIGKIFDPYFTTKRQGSGLGLATTYSIIKKHKGHIVVDSTVNKGTKFSIYLPASPEKEVEQKNTPTKLNIGHGKILVMDDEENIRKVATNILSHLGYEVTCACDGNEAIRLYTEALNAGHPFSLVIMDLTVPGGMGGKAAVAELTKIDPAAKVIVSSGYSNDPILSDFKKYGFIGMVAKPYTIEELDKVVVNALEIENLS